MPTRKARFIYFLNPDTELLPGSLWALYNGINEDETIGRSGRNCATPTARCKAIAGVSPAPYRLL